METILPSRSRHEPRIDIDIIIVILEMVLLDYGSEGRSGLLVVNKAVSEVLYSAFYATIRLSHRGQVSRLCTTLLFYPKRVRYVRSLSLVVGRFCNRFPVTNTLHYPEHHCRGQWVGRPIVEGSVLALFQILTITAPFLRNLTVIGRCSVTPWTDFFRHLVLPRVISLEIPASLFGVIEPKRVPRVTHLRITVDMSDHDASYQFLLLQQDFTAYTSLSHLYIAYGRTNGLGMQIEEQIFRIRAGAHVRAVALEVNCGDRLACAPNELWKYDVNPKLVFVLHKDWEDVAINPTDFVWGRFELLEGEEDWRVEFVKSMVLVTDEHESDVWSQIESHLARRWVEFEANYVDAERQEILNAPELLLFSWGGRKRI